MIDYRFYLLDRADHICGPAVLRKFIDDATALAEARQMRPTDGIKVWQGARRAAKLSPLG